MEDNVKNTQNSDQELKLLLANVLANQTNNQQALAEEEDIDWMALLNKLIKGWKLIAVATVAMAVVGVAVALMQQRSYTVTITMAPEAKSSGGGSSLSGIASMLGMGSITSGSSTDALNVTFFPEICSSTPFLTDLFDVQVTPYVSKKELKKGAKPADPLALYDYMTREKGGLGALLKAIFPATEEEEPDTIVISNLSKKQNAVVQSLGRNISSEMDKKTGIITLNVTMDDPQIATQLADTVCKRLQEYIITYRTKKAKDDYDYYSKMCDEAKEKMIKTQALYAQSVDWDRSVILESINGEKSFLQAEANLAQQIYQQMQTQKEAAMAKYQELKPVFAVIQPATFPTKPNKSRKNTVLGFMFVGLLLSGAWVLYGKELWLQLQEQLHNSK